LNISLKYNALRASALILAIALSGCNITPPESADPVQTATPAPSASPGKQSTDTKVTGLRVEPAAVTISPGGKLSLRTIGTHTKGSIELSPSNGLRYTSSNPAAVSVDSSGNLQAAATSKTGDSAEITVQYDSLSQNITVKVKKALQDTIAVNAQGTAVVTNANESSVVVNKQRSLPDGYVPQNLVEPNIRFSFKEKSEKKLMQDVAARALEQLFAKAAEDKIDIYGISAYRSYATQKSLFEYYVKTQGEKSARQYSAQPGQSEHQTGLSIDVSSPSAKLSLEEVFANTKEGKWLAEHCAEFGFIIRYPKGKESITGYNYEPWHIRYVGKEIAQEIMSQGLTLEEYFSDAVPVSTR
jgi:zinc D-Ala-D-Ala carboxypeptidase